MTSPNGLSLDGRRKPPVFHFLKLSCALPSNGFRYTNQGSHIERGITLISLNSSWAALGRSPPRIVMVRRIISPRRSKPASASAHETIYETSGLEATTTCAPGTSFGSKSVPQVTKNACNSSSCSGDNVVNLGRGDLICPSKDGGILHTPPLPLRSFACCSGVYSWSPYGGSVTTA